MLITASILITATLVHIRNAETSPSITSTETRCLMDAATQRVAIARNNLKLMRRRTSSIGRSFAVLAVLFGAFGLKAGASARMIHHYGQFLSPLRLSKQFSAVLGRERPNFLDECDLLFVAELWRGRSARGDRDSNLREEFLLSRR